MSLIPATILTGFLGSGKTTLLKRVLAEAHGEKIAVIENEFGEENIDNDILVTDSKEQIVQMSNGCICCTIREDLRATLTDLAEKKRKGELDFDRIVIETTGLADPGPVAQTFFLDDDLKGEFVIDAIVTLVDARHFEQQCPSPRLWKIFRALTLQAHRDQAIVLPVVEFSAVLPPGWVCAAAIRDQHLAPGRRI